MTSVSSEMNYSPEVLGLVFCYLENINLKATRQVYRTFEQEVVPFLFDAVLFSIDCANLEMADYPLRGSIKTVICSAINYET